MTYNNIIIIESLIHRALLQRSNDIVSDLLIFNLH